MKKPDPSMPLEHKDAKPACRARRLYLDETNKKRRMMATSLQIRSIVVHTSVVFGY